MSCSSSAGYNSPQTDSINAPPLSPEMVAPPPFLPFPIFPLTPQVYLSQEVQPWKGNERDKGEDSKELRQKAEEDAENEANNTLIRASSMCKRRRRASQTDFDSSTFASSMFDSDSKES